MIDRKRKFLDTDLAHDSEGSRAFSLGSGGFKWHPGKGACTYVGAGSLAEEF